MSHLGFQRPLLNLGDALLDDEGDAVRAALRSLHEVLPKELQLPLELLVPALDGQGFQALLVAGQVALEKQKSPQNYALAVVQVSLENFSYSHSTKVPFWGTRGLFWATGGVPMH